MVKIRLARVGKRGHATFRVVVTEHTRPPKSGSLEQLGSYDPHGDSLRVDADRLKARLAHGATLSPTLHNLLIEHKILEGKKLLVWKPKRREEADTAAPAGAVPRPTKKVQPSTETPQELPTAAETPTG